MTIELKEYIEMIIHEHESRNLDRIKMLEKQVESLEDLMDAKLQALALAVEKQEAAYDARFEGVNEWRQTFGDLANRAVSQDVFAARMDGVVNRLNYIEQQLANYAGRIIGYTAGMGLIVLIISIVSQLLNIGG